MDTHIHNYTHTHTQAQIHTHIHTPVQAVRLDQIRHLVVPLCGRSVGARGISCGVHTVKAHFANQGFCFEVLLLGLSCTVTHTESKVDIDNLQIKARHVDAVQVRSSNQGLRFEVLLLVLSCTVTHTESKVDIDNLQITG